MNLSYGQSVTNSPPSTCLFWSDPEY
jgi:hypothetical protein